ncbi:helix-turn-helix domain-containing protein [Eubacterium sp. MSJ-13]|uniref:HTH domain-containing protein n=1 Tax=Eubacterium sp. MSJ-13 TaxID=2841513 RepID=UPI001C118499|nr:helix-turn-helix domain-containing protein [Eubacterium sp. MSJ-13]MBU5478105.1 helix-turn-helix domain-containing protein [Eubacterium sp. MSJ-13]
MIQRELQKLLDILKTDEYITASNIAEKLDVSEKTARTRIKLLNDELEDNGAQIISKARFGYKLNITEQEKFDKLFKKEESDKTSYIPDNGNVYVAYRRISSIKCIDTRCSLLLYCRSYSNLWNHNTYNAYDR